MIKSKQQKAWAGWSVGRAGLEFVCRRGKYQPGPKQTRQRPRIPVNRRPTLFAQPRHLAALFPQVMLRSPFAVLSLVQSFPPPESREGDPIKSSKRRKVTFDNEGQYPSTRVKPLTVALSRATKHETRPSTLKMSRFSETLDLESASAWDKFYLTRLGVLFERTEYTPLETLITDPIWYDPETEPTLHFAERISCSNITDGRLSPHFEGVGGHHRTRSASGASRFGCRGQTRR